VSIRIVLDTSILRRDPTFRSGPVEALSRFAEAGYVDVYIPQVVEEEFKLLPSSRIEALDGLKTTLKKLRKNSPEEFH
jgi:rRNA-processing protein FCF1